MVQAADVRGGFDFEIEQDLSFPNFQKNLFWKCLESFGNLFETFWGRFQNIFLLEKSQFEKLFKNLKDVFSCIGKRPAADAVLVSLINFLLFI